MIRIFTFSSVSFASVSASTSRRALHVGLDDDRQFLHAAFGDLRLQGLEREPGAFDRARDFAYSSRNGDLPRLGFKT